MLHVQYNMFLSIMFPMFPNFQFSKLTFFRDSSFSLTKHRVINTNIYYPNKEIFISIEIIQLQNRLLFIHMVTYLNQDFTEIV